MQLGWGLLAMILLAAALVWFWQDSLAARESANAAAKEACNHLGLQFLDGTVAFARVALIRDAGWLRLRRTYVFDYTATSIERRQGFVLLTGHRVESVGYAPGEPQPDVRPVAPHSTLRPGAGNVLDLRDWRERHDPATGGSGSREMPPENPAPQPPRRPEEDAH
jgi:Protein of unknown function (DUF3301)